MRRAGIAVLAVVIVVIALKFLVPVAANLFLGLGVEVPLPRWVPPGVAIPLFLVGGPILFVALIMALAQATRRS